jgi:CheY-like chemotaxis protein
VRILAAEDSRDNQMLLERYLKAQGMEVDFAFNGEEAIEKALKGQYDLILMDIQMPVLDGYSATQRLRALGFKKPIIAVTAHALPEERERSLREGCDGHVVKPIDRRQLYESIRKLVHKDKLQNL